MKNKTTYKLILCALFVALIIIGAFIKIPIPLIPITLQVTFTTLAGLLLGGKAGALCCGVYALMGLIGLPVFTQGGGLGYVLKPSFGYIIGFIIGAYVSGVVANRVPSPSFKRLFGASLLGLFCVYLSGTVYFYFISALYLGNQFNIIQLLTTCVFITLPGDLILSVLSCILAKRLIPHIKKLTD